MQAEENSFTPESVITQVTWEDADIQQKEEDAKDISEFAAMLGQSNEQSVREGTIVNGTVINIHGDSVIVDIGHKAEGEVPMFEFTKGERDPVAVGDQVEVFLDTFEDSDGELVLSREKAIVLRTWDKLEVAHDNDEVVEGVIMARIKGGLAVDIGVKAFLPGSLVDLRPVRNVDKLIGNKLQFKIIKFNKERRNIVLSRRVLLEQDREKLRATTLNNLAEGAILKGIIKNITDYGAFVDLGGIDGLLHITDMSWGRISHPSQIFEVGQEIEVKVLSYDPERQRVSLGFKQFQDDPWEIAKEKYKEEQRCSGKVVSLTDFGAFVELEEGVEGLIHVSEMSWSKRVKHPSKFVQIGETVDVVVLAIDHEHRRISLGMKQIEPNPWEVVKEKYQEGDVIRGTIRNITDFGVFVGIEDGIDGLIHVSDFSWTEKIKSPADKYEKGDEVEAKILQIDIENERFSLGIKQLEEDPWAAAFERHPVGSKGQGTVTKTTDFGAFVTIEENVEGMIHISELDENGVDKVTDIAKVGESIDFVVLASSIDERRIALSRKAFQQNLDDSALKEYITKLEPQTTMAAAFSEANLQREDFAAEKEAAAAAEAKDDSTEG